MNIITKMGTVPIIGSLFSYESRYWERSGAPALLTLLLLIACSPFPVETVKFSSSVSPNGNLIATTYEYHTPTADIVRHVAIAPADSPAKLRLVARISDPDVVYAEWVNDRTLRIVNIGNGDVELEPGDAANISVEVNTIIPAKYEEFPESVIQKGSLLVGMSRSMASSGEAITTDVLVERVVSGGVYERGMPLNPQTSSVVLSVAGEEQFEFEWREEDELVITRVSTGTDARVLQRADTFGRDIKMVYENL